MSKRKSAADEQAEKQAQQEADERLKATVRQHYVESLTKHGYTTAEPTVMVDRDRGKVLRIVSTSEMPLDAAERIASR